VHISLLATEENEMSCASSDVAGVTSFVHVGLVVEDLPEMLRFLTVLGFDCGEPGVYRGDWIDRIIGLEDTEMELSMVRLPDGSDVFEVVRFRSPLAQAQEAAPAANQPGMRHISFSVEDMHAIVERVQAAGWGPVGEVVNYEDMYLLCYLRGPEGVIVELAQSVKRDR
jgi:catechol 2,3-dioxygenase-like lactoylglutathione lyase family enzyme